MDNRVRYGEMRSWLLSCYYSYCRTKLFYGKDWAENEHELGYAYDQYCDAFNLTIEEVMLEVLVLVLAAGRLPKSETYHRERIVVLLNGRDLDEMVCELGTEEKEEFLHDLKLLKLI